MPKLILIKHASPQQDPARPAHEWSLSAGGRERAATLAERLGGHRPARVIASEEPKATETGRIIGEALKVSFATAPGLQEHDRSNVPLMTPPEFISSVALMIKKPNELVLGRETAAAALERFTAAMDAILSHHPAEDLAIVSHGTVLALFLAARTGEDAFQLWRRMGLPSYTVVELPAWKIVDRMDRV